MNNKVKTMIRKRFIFVAIACIASLFCVSFSFKTQKNSLNNTDQIIGVWQIVSPALIGEGQEKIKIITKERFIWTHSINGEIMMSLGGTYSFDGDIYTENIKFGTSNQRIAFGKKFINKIRFENNKMYTSGGYENDPRIFNEIWERVE
ncbi:MAG: hypothetical protein LBL33_08470 [Tannerella sp.]|jgi:hypothetical protein|nr:hypothetical protein [Tannerella sp.]